VKVYSRSNQSSRLMGYQFTNEKMGDRNQIVHGWIRNVLRGGISVVASGAGERYVR
jgi:acylphosphatase